MQVEVKSSIPTMFLVLSLFFGLHFLTTNAAGDIHSDRQKIESLIEAGKLTDAQMQTEKLKADYTKDSALPEALYWVARRYGWSNKKYEEEKSIYRQIIQNYPDSLYASKSRLGLARAEIKSLIKNRQYKQADEAVETMVADFAGHPDLPGTLYWIAEEYRWGNKYEKAKVLHQHIIQNYPDSPSSAKAALGLARAETLSLIDSRNYDQAEKILNKLKTDFSGHPDLPDTLYWIAGGYRWKDKYEMAKNLYGRIIQEYPESSAADKARQQFHVVVEGLDVFALIESGREKKAQDAINRLMAKAASDESGEISPYTVFLCGDRYYARGYQKKKDGFNSGAKKDFLKAIDTWQNMIQQLPASTSVALAYYHSANCYREMGDYEHAIEQYVKLLENYPDYYLAWDVHFKIGRYYQKLKDAGAVESSTADVHTKAFYEQMLEKYPDCHAAKAAQNWLKKHAK